VLPKQPKLPQLPSSQAYLSFKSTTSKCSGQLSAQQLPPKANRNREKHEFTEKKKKMNRKSEFVLAFLHIYVPRLTRPFLFNP
jgi:hypothetical protein